MAVEVLGAALQGRIYGVDTGAEGRMYNMMKESIIDAANSLLGSQCHCCITSNRVIVNVSDEFVPQE
jgi:hypothetical protein